MKSTNLKLVERTDMRPVASKGRKPNEAYRVREHLTEDEVSKLLAALKANRHGQRDWLIGLLIYRHGLRVSEACDLRWDDVSLTKRTIQVRRLKGSDDSTHYLERDELAGLRRLQREQDATRRGSSAKERVKSARAALEMTARGHPAIQSPSRARLSSRSNPRLRCA